MKNKKLALMLGALCKPVKEQLTEQGISFDEKEIDKLQNHFDAITGLKIAGFLTETQAHNARQKVMNYLAKKVS